MAGFMDLVSSTSDIKVKFEDTLFEWHFNYLQSPIAQKTRSATLLSAENNGPKNLFYTPPPRAIIFLMFR